MSIFAEAEKRQAFNRFKGKVDVDSDGNVQEVTSLVHVSPFTVLDGSST